MYMYMYMYIAGVSVQVKVLCVCRDNRDGVRLGVNRSNLLLRGCVLRNTTRVAGLVVYAGTTHMYMYMYMNNITCFCIADSQTLRGCVCVHVAGHQTKALLNNSGPKVKRSKLEKDINTEVISQLFILLAFCLIGAIGTMYMYIHTIYTCTVRVKKKLPINGPFNGRPFHENGARTGPERAENGPFN